MTETTFYPDAAEIAQIASIYERTEAGDWRKTSHDWVTHGRLESRDRYPKANAGLFSTAGDYARFCRCLLKGGEGLISRESYRALTTVQTGELETGFTPGNAWGLGCAITRTPQGVTGDAFSRDLWPWRTLWNAGLDRSGSNAELSLNGPAK